MASRKSSGRKRKGQAQAKPADKPAKRSRAAARAPRSRFPEVEDLVQLMDRHGLLEVDVETDGKQLRRLRVSRTGQATGAFAAPAGGQPPAPAPLSQPTPAASAPRPDVPMVDETLHAFRSPMVGTFYRAPSPEAAPFVSVGDKVDPSTLVCIIEAMKVMNEIQPDKAGQVVSIEVENGEAVEFGQTLFLIRPA
ncbi:MAG: acetyl-CoA carboxylase biotin carboxyl carrier protein [Planctomycetota bacterium]